MGKARSSMSQVLSTCNVYVELVFGRESLRSRHRDEMMRTFAGTRKDAGFAPSTSTPEVSHSVDALPTTRAHDPAGDSSNAR